MRRALRDFVKGNDDVKTDAFWLWESAGVQPAALAANRGAESDFRHGPE